MFLSSAIQATVSPESASYTDSLKAITDWTSLIKTCIEIVAIVIVLLAILLSPRLYLWYIRRKRLIEKQANASIDYYPRLQTALSRLKSCLLNADQMETKDPSRGNIFALAYTADYREKHYPYYREYKLNGKSELEKDVKAVNELLISEDIVHPIKTKESEWRYQMKVIKNFCDFILNSSHRGRENPYIYYNITPPHIERAKELECAFDFILDATKTA